MYPCRVTVVLFLQDSKIALPLFLGDIPWGCSEEMLGLHLELCKTTLELDALRRVHVADTRVIDDIQ